MMSYKRIKIIYMSVFVTREAGTPVSYTHLDVYKRPVPVPKVLRQKGIHFYICHKRQGEMCIRDSLKSGRINNRLLCELATHKDFIKFLADIEIYVDGIATMQIQNLNTLVDTVRHEIIERYRPGEDDPHLKVLQAAHISDGEYFSHMVLDDLNLIIRDIRETHKKDSESAPQTTVADELKENLEAVENFKMCIRDSLRRTQCTNFCVVYNCALNKLRGFRLLPFQQFFQYILRVLPVKNEFQQQHDIIVRQAFRLLQKTFQHTATGTEPVCPFLSGKLL